MPRASSSMARPSGKLCGTSTRRRPSCRSASAMTSASGAFWPSFSSGAATFDHDSTRSTRRLLPRAVHLQVAHHQDARLALLDEEEGVRREEPRRVEDVGVRLRGGVEETGGRLGGASSWRLVYRRRGGGGGSPVGRGARGARAAARASSTSRRPAAHTPTWKTSRQTSYHSRLRAWAWKASIATRSSRRRSRRRRYWSERRRPSRRRRGRPRQAPSSSASATSTSTSKNVAPPPMSVSSWLVTAFALRPPGHILAHQIERPTTTPGTRRVGDARLRQERAAVVEDAHHRRPPRSRARRRRRGGSSRSASPSRRTKTGWAENVEFRKWCAGGEMNASG